jgi:hypothetical protein
MLQRVPPSDRERARRRDATRRRRQRARKGEAVALVTYNGRILDLLERTHHLTDCDTRDRHKVGEAITRLLEEAANAKNL